MTNLLRLTSLAAAAAVVALSSTPASAQQVGVTGTKPTANARIIRPLILTGVRNLDFGTIVLGSVPVGGSLVEVTATGARNCAAGVTCSAAFQTARYNVQGTQGQNVQVTSGPVTLTGSNGGTLAFTTLVPATFSLPNSGSPGRDFDVGGQITVLPTTIDGVYSGDMEVFVQYP